MTSWVNGVLSETIAVRDRGFLYGDGLFETMRVHNGAVRLLPLHLERLKGGAARLGIMPPSDALLAGEIAVAAASHKDTVLKLILTRGQGPRGYQPAADTAPSRVLIAEPVPEHVQSLESAKTVGLCQTRLGANTRLAGLKTLNRLECVLARAEWTDSDIAECLMLDDMDQVVGGTMSNIFVRFDTALCTPLLDRCGVAGVMRRWVMETMQTMGNAVTERRLRLSDLDSAREIFLTNALIGIWSVGELRQAWGTWRLTEFGAAEQLRTHLRRL
jgi:4-amino-4-deoxychorismate lyase